MKPDLQVLRDIEKRHGIILTVGMSKCIEKHATTPEDVVGFGMVLQNGNYYLTVHIRDAEGIEREWYWDAELWGVQEVGV